MFKRIVAIILLLAFSVQSFSQAFIVLGYYSNAGAYARNCINKSRPKLHCNGKCQMMKKMQEEEKNDQQVPVQKTGYEVQVLYSKSFFATLNIPVFSTRIYKRHNAGDAIHRTLSIFHPPQV